MKQNCLLRIPHPMHTFAAVDIGSNSCRLKIARVVQHRLKVVHEDREVTRLGASVFESGVISPVAMSDTLAALKRFYRSVQSFSADKVRAVATSAMRDARNARAFLAWVQDETGWNVEIISGLEEGRLIHRGVMSNEPGTAGQCLLIDLGGGSCELSLSAARRIKDTISLPLGAVRLTQEFLPQRSANSRRHCPPQAVHRSRTSPRRTPARNHPRPAGHRHFGHRRRALRRHPRHGQNRG